MFVCILFNVFCYIVGFQYKNTGLQIHIMQKVNLIAFEPPFKNYSEALLKTVDAIIEAVMAVPRLESQLYLDYQEEPEYLKVLQALGCCRMCHLSYFCCCVGCPIVTTF